MGTAVACKLGLEASFPFVKFVSAESMVAFGDQTKALKINQVFEDAYKSEKSVVILDDIERLLGYTPVGPRFSVRVMETLQVLCRKDPPEGRSICIIATSTPNVIEDRCLAEVFDIVSTVPMVNDPSQIKQVMKSMNLELISTAFQREVGIKTLNMIIESAVEADGSVTNQGFREAMELYGFTPAN